MQPSNEPAPRVLMLHGQPGCGALWKPVVRAVRDRFRLLYPEGFSLLAPDRPGWGDSERTACGIAENADVAAELLASEGDQRAVVIGHSWGGAVALALALRHPARVAGLVLLAPAANPAAVGRVDRLLATPVLGSLALAAGVGGAGTLLRQTSLRSTVARHRSAALAIDALRNPARDWRSFSREQQALVHEVSEIGAQLENVQAPTMIIVGSDDRTVRPDAAKELADHMPNAEYLELPAQGHHLPTEAVDQVASAAVIATSRVLAA